MIIGYTYTTLFYQHKVLNEPFIHPFIFNCQWVAAAMSVSVLPRDTMANKGGVATICLFHRPFYLDQSPTVLPFLKGLESETTHLED